MRGRETVERRGGRGGGNKGAEEQGRGWACSSRPSLPPRPPRSKRTPFTPGSLLAHKREKKEHTRRKQEQKGEWREERKEAVKEEAFSRSYLPYLGRPGVGARPRLRSGAIRESRGAPRADDDPFQAAILSPHSLFNPRPFTAHRILPPFALSSPSPIPISLPRSLPSPPRPPILSVERVGAKGGHRPRLPFRSAISAFSLVFSFRFYLLLPLTPRLWVLSHVFRSFSSLLFFSSACLPPALLAVPLARPLALRQRDQSVDINIYKFQFSGLHGALSLLSLFLAFSLSSLSHFLFPFFSRKTFKGKASNAFGDHAFLRLISRLLINRGRRRPRRPAPTPSERCEGGMRVRKRKRK